jgi:hypothetical protein
VDTFGGGKLNESCTACPEGRGTGKRVGVKIIEQCCLTEDEIFSLGKCVNKMQLYAGVLAVVIVGGLLVVWSVLFFREGQLTHEIGVSERIKCRNASFRGRSRPDQEF